MNKLLTITAAALVAQQFGGVPARAAPSEEQLRQVMLLARSNSDAGMRAYVAANPALVSDSSPIASSLSWTGRKSAAPSVVGAINKRLAFAEDRAGTKPGKGKGRDKDNPGKGKGKGKPGGIY